MELMAEAIGPYDTYDEALEAGYQQAQAMEAQGYYIDTYYVVEREDGFDAMIEYAKLEEEPGPVYYALPEPEPDHTGRNVAIGTGVAVGVSVLLVLIYNAAK